MEIGGEFWDVPICGAGNNLFPTDTKWLLAGRSALKYIITDIKTKRAFQTVAIPSWCCDSMIAPFVDAGVEVNFYPVCGSIQNLPEITTDAVLVIDYFGYTSQSSRNNYEGIVIRDVTHSIFSYSYDDADYYFGSLRKWAGFWTGGYAWKKGAWGVDLQLSTPDECYVYLREKAMQEKAEYILGLHSSKDYLSLFSKAEKLLDDRDDISRAADRDIELAQKLDIEFLRTQRRENAQRLLMTVTDIALFPILQSSDCPLFVPILVRGGKRDSLRRFLIQNEIYCPIHWPVSEIHQLNEATQRIYDEELSLVCDQRYSVEAMDRICALIEDFRDREKL